MAFHTCVILLLGTLDAGFALRLGDEAHAARAEEQEVHDDKNPDDNDLGWMNMKFKEAHYNCIQDGHCKHYSADCDKCSGASKDAKARNRAEDEGKGICVRSERRGGGLCGPWYDASGRFVPLAEWEANPEYMKQSVSEPRPGKWLGELKLGKDENAVTRGFGKHHPNFGDFEIVEMDRSTYSSAGQAVEQLNSDPAAPQSLAAVYSATKGMWYLFWRDDQLSLQKKSNMLASQWFESCQTYLRLEKKLH